MKKLLIISGICIVMAACQSHRATNATDSGTMAKPDTSMVADSLNKSKPDPPGKSDGAGTGPAYGSGSKSPDSAKGGKKP
jgi:hypothetical protein